MYVKRLTIENIKGFSGSHVFEFSEGLNYLVGDNNCGKSTVYDALIYLLSGRNPGEEFRAIGVEQPIRVEAVLSGEDLRVLVSDDKFAKYSEYLHVVDGQDSFRVERLDASRNVVQGSGKSVALTGKVACFWHPGRVQFENPSGIDALFKALLDLQPIWADENPGELADFSTTKTLGRLVNESASSFFETQRWHDFLDAHGTAFAGNEDDSLVGHAKGIAVELQKLVEEQYGEASVRLDFVVPEPVAFVKMGRVLVDDGAGETVIGSKGTGMQRAFALAVIQLYARSRQEAGATSKRHVLLLDEPETWLHPKAQLRLGAALAEIARAQQVFLITHSPYLLKTFESQAHQLTVFKGRGISRTVNTARSMGAGGSGSPSWGEITYVAFGIASREFHDELFGRAYAACHAELALAQDRIAREDQVDAWLEGKGLGKSSGWARPGQQAKACTLPTRVRNFIHHPENTSNGQLSDDELAASVHALVPLVL